MLFALALQLLSRFSFLKSVWVISHCFVLRSPTSTYSPKFQLCDPLCYLFFFRIPVASKIIRERGVKAINFSKNQLSVVAPIFIEDTDVSINEVQMTTTIIGVATSFLRSSDPNTQTIRLSGALLIGGKRPGIPTMTHYAVAICAAARHTTLYSTLATQVPTRPNDALMNANGQAR